MLTQQLRLGNKKVIDEIIGGHMALAFQIVTRYVGQAPTKTDDLLSVALVAVVQAVNWFCERSKDDNITPYVVATVHSQLADYITHDNVVRITRYRLRKLAEEYQLTEEPNLPSIISTDVEINYRSPVARQINRALLINDTHYSDCEIEEILDRLTLTRFQTIVIRMKMAGSNESEIAKSLGCTRQRVHQVKEDIKTILLPHFFDLETELCKCLLTWTA